MSSCLEMGQSQGRAQRSEADLLARTIILHMSLHITGQKNPHSSCLSGGLHKVTCSERFQS